MSTTDQLRDEIARKMGWQQPYMVPASLDWLSENWPKGWWVNVEYNERHGRKSWTAEAYWKGDDPVKYADGDTELEARLALFLAVLNAGDAG